MRSTGGHGFPTADIFCHSPDHKIYEFSPDGKTRKTFATLPTPYPPAGDGALAFDTVGRFGHRLLAATGRSGAGIHPPGGALYAIGRSGKVEEVATYSGPGGADEVLVAPLSFGSAAGDALLTVDAATDGGSLVAIDPSGQQRTIATFPDGPNPIVALSRPSAGRPGRPMPGLYLTDDTSSNVYYAPAASLAAFAGDVLIGTESHARFWIVAPRGDGFATIPVRTNLGLPTYSLEQMIAVR